MLHALAALLQPLALIKALGLAGLFCIIFAESGLFFGFFLPGDSLLFTAGILASQGFFGIGATLLGVFLAAVLGDSVGYWFGAKVGIRMFTSDTSFFFNRKYIDRTSDFYAKHGTKTIFLARFVPVVRTFAPVLAGLGGMRYRTFLAYNVVGGFVWSVGVTLLGYFLGASVPGIDRYLLPVILVIILASFIPVFLEVRKARRHS